MTEPNHRSDAPSIIRGPLRTRGQEIEQGVEGTSGLESQNHLSVPYPKTKHVLYSIYVSRPGVLILLP